MEAYRLLHQDWEDLEWFFNSAEASLGLRSHSFEPGTVTSEAADWRAIESAHRAIHAVDRWRKIDQRLGTLVLAHRRALRAFYGHRQGRGQPGDRTLLTVLPLAPSYNPDKAVTKQARVVWDEAERLLSAASQCYAWGRGKAREADAVGAGAYRWTPKPTAPHRCRASDVYLCPCGARGTV